MRHHGASYSECFLVVLTPAYLWYHAWFPRYRHLTLFVTQQQQEQELFLVGQEVEGDVAIIKTMVDVFTHGCFWVLDFGLVL